MAKIPGSIWVEGTGLHYIDNTGDEWYYTGTYIASSTGAIPGTIWVQSSSNSLRYVDGVGDVREIADAASVISGGVAGSLWIEGGKIHFAASNIQEKEGHTDVAHTREISQAGRPAVKSPE